MSTRTRANIPNVKSKQWSVEFQLVAGLESARRIKDPPSKVIDPASVCEHENFNSVARALNCRSQELLIDLPPALLKRANKMID